MDDPLGRIAILLIGLAVIYFLSDKVMRWVGDFIRQGIPFSQKLFILGGIVLIYFSFAYPEDTQIYMEKIWVALQEFYKNNF